jgi:hypothetical protein
MRLLENLGLRDAEYEGKHRREAERLKQELEVLDLIHEPGFCRVEGAYLPFQPVGARRSEAHFLRCLVL